MDGHIHLRLGEILHEKSDKWWEILEDTDIDKLASEINQNVRQAAVPYVKTYLDENEAVALWESGQSPGQTDYTRAKYLIRRTLRRGVSDRSSAHEIGDSSNVCDPQKRFSDERLNGDV